MRELAEVMDLSESVRQSLKMDKSGILARLVVNYYLLWESPAFNDLTVESPWLTSILWLTAIAKIRHISADMGTGFSGCRDLHVIEHIVKRWDKKFSFQLGGNNKQLKEYRLQADVLKNVIKCLGWFLEMGFSKNYVRFMFVEIFYEQGLTPYSSNGVEPSTKREIERRFQSQNRRLMKVADDFENPFDKDLMPSTYRFIETCNIQSGQSDDFRKQYWYPLIKSRQVWTTWFISNGMIVTLNNQTNKITSDNRGRPKNKIVKSSQRPRQ